MDKLKMKSKDKIQENIQKIRALFPNAVMEVLRDGTPMLAVDFDILKQEMSNVLVDDKEQRYQFTWPDKNKSILRANTPIAATLRPCKEESVDFDNTQNLYIEGDNLEVLKLLQETYLGKIKMIYIDPPYNTGNDFVYKDDFSQDSEEYLDNSGQYDEYGNRLVQNAESNGRFHTDWLNMIYPRLRLAKDLLSDDGVIFISIDDNEYVNLCKQCEEIFGASNFISTIKVLSNPRGRQSTNYFANSGEYVLVYSQNKDLVNIIGDLPSQEQIASYNKVDQKGKFRDLGLRKRGSDSRREDSPTLYFPIYFNPTTNDISLENGDGYITILPKLEDGSDGRWRWSPAKIKADRHLLYCRQVSRNGGLEYDVFQKDYLSEESRVKHKDFWIEKEINYDRSSEEIRSLFAEKLFDFAKPLYLIKKIINCVINDGDTVLDFFSGSATTAHAVMQLNAQDGGKRKFIMVQLPELCDENIEAYKAGYKNICEIGKERIRRAGKKINEQNNSLKAVRIIQSPEQLNVLKALKRNQDAILDFIQTQPKEDISFEYLDTGFRVLKLDSSNMKDVYYRPEDYKQSLLDMFEDNIKEDRTPLDLLFQVMLDLGKPLSAKIEEKEVAGKHIFVVDSNDLIACFDKDITDEVVKAIAQMKPLYAVFRDSSMANDSVGTNFEQIFATYSPNTTRKVL